MYFVHENRDNVSESFLQKIAGERVSVLLIGQKE